MSLCDNVLFIFDCFMINKTTNGVTKHRKSTQPNSSKTVKLFLRQASSMLRQPLVYARNNSILYWAVHDPIAFSQVRGQTRCS